MVPRRAKLYAHQCLVLPGGGVPVAVGGLWMEPPFCLSVSSG